LEKRSDLQGKLNEMRHNSHELVAQWLASRNNAPRAVAGNALVLRLRLDEGSGEELRNSAPNANPASFRTTTLKGEWGETTWLWPDFRMQSSTRVLLGQMGDYDSNQAFSSGGWFMFRSAPFHPGSFGTLLSKMDSTNHDRGWELAADDGFLSVALVNRTPKDANLGRPSKKSKNKGQGEKDPEAKEPFNYPTPQDLSKKDLAPNKPPLQKKAEEEAAKKDKAEAKTRKAATSKPPKDATPTVGLRVVSITPLSLDGAWKHIFFTYDGSGHASGIRIFVNGSAIATRVVSDNLGQATIRNGAPLQLGWRNPEEHPAKDARYQDIRLYARLLSPDEVCRLPFEDYAAEIAALPASQWTTDQWHVMSEFYLNHVDPSNQAIQRNIASFNKELDRLSQGGDLTQVSWEKPSLAYAHVLTRGVYTARTERVEADTPHFLSPLPSGESHNRLALARWTVSPANPLTPRVAVNRMWYELFGNGIVETTEDFGIMGQRPTHPELLDWLAVEFRESGWNIKHIYKLMVMSAAYRQSAKSNPQQLAKDPRNLFLSHGPRFRMDAEMLRDTALEASGLLVRRIGGPSVKPYQPDNIWEEVSYPTSDTVHYVQEHGNALYRRSMYTYVKRMASPPNMDTFDAPMRDVACTRRQRTDTPLQALVTMNDVQWVEAARALAQRVIRETPDTQQRINRMSEFLLAHDAPLPMAAALATSVHQMQEHYARDSRAARALVEIGEKNRDPSIPESELAAWTVVASEMLNLDETINK
jgi:hypothetical protein